MGKTLGSIITLGAAIAVNVIPGVGQALSGALASTFGVGVGSAIAGALTLGVTAAGLQAGIGLLGLGPSAPKPQTTESAIKTPRPDRVAGYGIRRTTPTYFVSLS